MGFLDKLSDSITTGAGKVSEKTKELTTVASLNSAIDKDNKTLNALYAELGKSFYEQYKDELVAKFPETVAKVDELVASIAANQESIRQTKGIGVCPQCGKELPKDTKFCPGCGYKIPEPVMQAPTSGAVCANCGAPLETGALFCTTCGTKVEA